MHEIEIKEAFQTKIKSKETQGKTLEVLYQKIGSRWYSFFLMEEEVYMGLIPEDALQTMQKIDSSKK